MPKLSAPEDVAHVGLGVGARGPQVAAVLESLGQRWRELTEAELGGALCDLDLDIVLVDRDAARRSRDGLVALIESGDARPRVWALIDGDPPDPGVLFHDELHAPVTRDALARRLRAHRDRIWVEESLRASEAAFRAIADRAPVAIWRAEADGAGGYINARMTEIMGVSREKALGDGWAEALHPDDRERVYRAWQAFAAGDAEYNETYRFVHEDGSVRWVQGQAVTLAAEGPVPAGHVGTLTDITELVSAREQLALTRDQLAAAQRLESLGRIAGGVAHDFNNLLTVISASAEALGAAMPPESDEARHAHEAISEATARAAQLVRKLLAFGRRQVLAMQVVDLNALILELRPILDSLVGEPRQLVMELAESELRVKADPRQIEQVVVNLIVNAREATSGDEPVRLRTSFAELSDADAKEIREGQPGAFVCLEVEDSGCGMDEATRAQIFEPFFTTKPDGTGLGLASSFGILRQTDGFIAAKSELGRGTTMSVYLPPAAGAPTPRVAPPDLEPDGGDEVVLVVDDLEPLRLVLARGLATYGYRVLTAGTVREAAELAADHAIDVLVCDVVMPDGGGAAAYRAVREARPGVGLVWMSGHATDAHVERRELDPDAPFLQKPFRAQRLAATIRSMLARRKTSPG